jgi:hypothetical protein
MEKGFTLTDTTRQYLTGEGEKGTEGEKRQVGEENLP